jgi:hypothetical protein
MLAAIFKKSRTGPVDLSVRLFLNIAADIGSI